MKLVILGDTHFGGSYSLGTISSYRKLNSRLIDFSNTFDYVVDYIKTNDVKHFAITGDIFEYRRPQASELGIFSEKLRRLAEIGVHTHIVIGNHDMIRDQGATTIDVLDKLKLPMIHIYTNVASAACKGDDGNIINLIFFPFRTRQMLDCSTNDTAVRRLKDRLQYEIQSIGVGPKILIGHFMLQGTLLGDSVVEGHVGEIALPTNMFDSLDGTIMGHIHPHNIIQKKPLIAYIGSMERKDFGDSRQPKYFLVVENNGGKLVYKFESLPVRPIHDVEMDHSDILDGKVAVEKSIDFLREFGKERNVGGSIVRVGVSINSRAAYDFDVGEIRSFLKKELNVFHCVGVNVHVASKRQLRKATITEQIDPIKSFEEYLTLIEDDEMRRLMYDRGKKIIGVK